MGDDPERDIRQLWQEQPHEEDRMRLEDIRARAQQFEGKTRRGNRLAAAILGLGMAVDLADLWARPDLLEGLGVILTFAAIAYLAIDYRRWLPAERMPQGLGLTASADFYRSQLARQRDMTHHAVWWFLAFVPGVGLQMLGRTLTRGEGLSSPRGLTFAAVAVALFAGILWFNARSAKKLQVEIDALA